MINKPILKIIAFAAAMMILGSSYAFTLFGNSELAEFGARSNPEDPREIDHESWDRLLKRYVKSEDGVNLFGYGAVSELDRELLAMYLEQLQGIEITGYAPDAQFAYWVNLYNALTVAEILKHYPLDSILDISYGLTSRGPWKEPLFEVEGMALSLDDIEHEILRPVFQDMRIHYAVNCASYSCPNLQNQAFTRNNLNALLEKGASQYINHPRGATLVDGELIVSSIYDWYADDFANDEAGLIDHLKQYANDDLRERLNKIKVIEDYHYDWSLNE